MGEDSDLNDYHGLVARITSMLRFYNGDLVNQKSFSEYVWDKIFNTSLSSQNAYSGKDGRLPCLYMTKFTLLDAPKNSVEITSKLNVHVNSTDAIKDQGIKILNEWNNLRKFIALFFEKEEYSILVGNEEKYYFALIPVVQFNFENFSWEKDKSRISAYNDEGYEKFYWDVQRQIFSLIVYFPSDFSLLKIE